MTIANQAKDLTGKRFGRAFVIEPVRLPERQLMWRCECDCGIIFNSLAHPFLSGKRTGCPSCSRKTYHDFWGGVKKGRKRECWEWQRAISEAGYGTLSFKRKPFGAHRMAWILTNGEISDNLFVCHKCDNPRCCNPAHLFLGTHKDNMRDRMNKGQYPNRFTGHSRAKLVGEKFNQFKLRLQAGEKPSLIAADFGIHYATACKIAKKLYEVKP